MNLLMYLRTFWSVFVAEMLAHLQIGYYNALKYRSLQRFIGGPGGSKIGCGWLPEGLTALNFLHLIIVKL